MGSGTIEVDSVVAVKVFCTLAGGSLFVMGLIFLCIAFGTLSRDDFEDYRRIHRKRFFDQLAMAVGTMCVGLLLSLTCLV